MACSSRDSSGSRVFSHDEGDLVLVKWNDGMVYFAKIKKIDARRRTCIVIFDDRSTDEASFSQIHSVDETTTDIICIKCKKDDSETPNEIVLCDSCGIGFHQKCHSPPIPASALELDNPWHCIYCLKHTKNPYLTESIDVMQSLFEEEGAEDEIYYKQVPFSPNTKIKVEKDSDAEETYEQPTVVQPSPPPFITPQPKKRKVGRPRLSESAKKSNRMKPLEVFRRKLARTNTGRASATRAYTWRKRQSSRELPSTPPSSNLIVSSTVESHTVSVQSLESSPAVSEVSSSLKPNNSSSSSSDSDSGDDAVLSKASATTGSEESFPRNSKRSRSLRVSLTLPPSVETSPVASAANKTSPPDASIVALASTQWTEPSTDAVNSSNNSPVATFGSTNESSLPEVEEINMECSEIPSSEVVQQETVIPAPITTTQPTIDGVQSTIEDASKLLPPPLTSELKEVEQKTQSDDSTTVHNPSPPPLNHSIVAPPCSEGVVPSPPPLNTEVTNQIKASKVEGDDDVIIIENKPGSKRGREPCSEMHNITTPTATSAANDAPNNKNSEENLVKIAAGVTTLKPSKFKRQSVIQDVSPPPVIHSPLEKLQLQVKQNNLLSRVAARKNSVSHQHVIEQSARPTANLPISLQSKPPQTLPVPPKTIISTTNTVPLSHGPPEPSQHVSVATNTISGPPQLSSTVGVEAIVQYSNRPREPPVKRPRLLPIETQERGHHNKHHSKRPAPLLINPQQQQIANYNASQVVQTSVVAANQHPVMTVATPGEPANVYTFVQTNNRPPHNEPAIIACNNVMSPPNEILLPSHQQQQVVIAHQPIDTASNPAVVYTPVQQTATLLADNNTTVVPYYIMEVPEQPSQQLTVNTTKPYAVVNAIPTNRHVIQSPPPLQSPPGSSFKIFPGNRRIVKNISQSQGTQTDAYKPGHAPPENLDKIREQMVTELVGHLHTLRNKNAKSFDCLTEEHLMDIFKTAYKQFQENAKIYNQFVGSALKSKASHRAPNVQVVANSPVPVQQFSRSSGRVIKPKPQRLLLNPSPPRRISPAASPTYAHQQGPHPPPNQPMHSSALRTPTTAVHHQKPPQHIQTSGLFVPPAENNREQETLQKQFRQATVAVQQQQRHGQSTISSTAPVSHDQTIHTQLVKNGRTYIVAESPTAIVTTTTSSATAARRPVAAVVESSKLKTAAKPSVDNSSNRRGVVSGAAKRKERDVNHVCTLCGKDATFLCSGCHVEWYCGRDCQLKAWDKHAEHCKV